MVCTGILQINQPRAEMRPACFGQVGVFVVSHPEGRAFIDQLRATSDLFLEPFPTSEEFEALLELLGFEVVTYRDESKLYLMVARKI